VVRQPVYLLVQPLGVERLQDVHYLGMQYTPSLLEQPPISHLMRQGVLKGVGTFGEQMRLVEKLGRLEVR
jgi:hypothetical protein